MSIEVRESVRGEMIADCLVLAFGANVDLGVEGVLDAITEVLTYAADPLVKISIEDSKGKKRTYAVDEAKLILRERHGFRFFRAIPRSEVGNLAAAWLTAVLAYCYSQNAKTLFLGVPKLHESETLRSHVKLVEALVARAIVPQYGFGFEREYGLGPEYFASGVVFNATSKEVKQTDWSRITAWGDERAGSPEAHPRRHRYTRGMILDVFPMNVLTDIHLRQLVFEVSLMDWIVQRTGRQSLVEISEKCYLWNVQIEDCAPISTVLRDAGLIIANPVTRTR